ncbi:MAG: leucine-rich repeat domain-containing protein, partial [Lachnospiraceae bacterium]|nr:leucine-rich repeat domain-containing protein [Lachnospiraceae bacterium]
VTSIGDLAFVGCTSLKSETIQNDVTRREEYAFGDCTNKQSLEIPNSVTSIRAEAFSACTALEVTVPDTVKEVGSSAFLNVKNVKYQGTLEGAPWGAKALNGNAQ